MFVLVHADPISKKRLKRKIGEHPDLSLEEARETTRRYNKLISKGLDPFQYLADQAKEEEKQKITLYEFAQIWKDTKITRKEKAPKAHIVPLSSQAIFLLEEIKKHNGNNKFVFSHHSDHTRHASSQTANSVLKRNGYKDVLTSHGLRAMARTYLADKGIDYQVAEACLAHAVGSGISRIYNRSDYYDVWELKQHRISQIKPFDFSQMSVV
ncbi:tyrosine-type recombinase/integrase [Gallibacterium anatis]|uniref:tyrosine-type recombinase/integrase n=1 Tax=Gallibacterium anatis TaxID=750 RepID=UPI0009B8573C|nr:integrase family protein [Gallibacterium anatis]